MKAYRNMQDFRQKRSEASEAWSVKQTPNSSPDDELGEVFKADGSFPLFGPLVAIQNSPFMYSDFGPAPAMRGFVFPDSDSYMGGRDNNYNWAELLQLPAGAVL